jgi:hypothetical protein
MAIKMNFHEKREYWLKLDPDKAPDLPFDTLIIEGVLIVSRYAQRHELSIMSRALCCLPPPLRKPIVSMFCDSKATYTYSIKLDGPRQYADTIGYALSDLFLASDAKGHNGINLSYGDGSKFGGDISLFDVEPHWACDDVYFD